MICGGGQIIFLLADMASASTHVPAQMAIYAGGRLPANTDGAVLAGGLSSRQHRWSCAGGQLKQPPPQMGFALAGR